jgi:hypothetical protein
VVYPAKRDWWIKCLMMPLSLVPLGVGVVIAYQTVTQAIPLLPGLLGSVLPIAVGLLLRSMYLGTSYEIGETDLVTRMGPFRFRVPLNAIEEVTATTGFRFVVGTGLSWSLDMLHVRYRKPGRWAWTVSIAPQDKTLFLLELAAVVPGLTIKGTGVGG